MITSAIVLPIEGNENRTIYAYLGLVEVQRNGRSPEQRPSAKQMMKVQLSLFDGQNLFACRGRSCLGIT